MLGRDARSMTSLAPAPSPTGRSRGQWTASLSVSHMSFVHLLLDTSMAAAHGSALLEFVFGHQDNAFLPPQFHFFTSRDPVIYCQRTILYLRLPVPPHLCNPIQSTPMLSSLVPNICILLS